VCVCVVLVEPGNVLNFDFLVVFQFFNALEVIKI